MPRYEYRCACGRTVFRVFAMCAFPAVVPCAACGGEAKRLFAVPQLRAATLSSEANQRGLAELDATRRTDEAVYARNWERRLPVL